MFSKFRNLFGKTPAAETEADEPSPDDGIPPSARLVKANGHNGSGPPAYEQGNEETEKQPEKNEVQKNHEGTNGSVPQETNPIETTNEPRALETDPLNPINQNSSVIPEDLDEAESPTDGSGSPDSGSGSAASDGAAGLVEEASASATASGFEGSEEVPVTTTTTTIVEPTGKNAIAVNAIAQKLNEIAEVAESLDSAIKDIQAPGDAAEVKKAAATTTNLKNASSEQNWQSRSIDDESYATASDGNFTIRSTSGRTASFVSCGKESFDASEADDSMYALEMPELTSPLNQSYASSEHSFVSAQQPPTHSLNDSAGAVGGVPLAYHDDQSSEADVDELRSQSVTPTPTADQGELRDYTIGIPIVSESETELESCIADAPSMEILTELEPLASSHTPEVSTRSNAHGPQGVATNHGEGQSGSGTRKPPNAAWRRSKYYENITKQTIKGFL